MRGATAAATAGALQPVLHSLRVLVVDDNIDSANSLAAFLSLVGHDTEVCFEGEQAAAAAASFDADVVLLDIGMPTVDGYEVCRAIRSQQRKPPVVVVGLSGWGLEEDRRKSREAGFDEHLLKPVEPAALELRLADIGLALAARRTAADAVG